MQKGGGGESCFCSLSVHSLGCRMAVLLENDFENLQLKPKYVTSCVYHMQKTFQNKLALLKETQNPVYSVFQFNCF